MQKKKKIFGKEWQFTGGIAEVVEIPIDAFTFEFAPTWEENVTEDIDYEIVEPKQLPAPDDNSHPPEIPK